MELASASCWQWALRPDCTTPCRHSSKIAAPSNRAVDYGSYNFLVFSGIIGRLGSLLSLGRDHWGCSSGKDIFLVCGIVTSAGDVSIVRLLPFHTTRLAMRLLMKCMICVVKVEGLENYPEGQRRAGRLNHAVGDGVLLGLCWPRHPRMNRLC